MLIESDEEDISESMLIPERESDLIANPYVVPQSTRDRELKEASLIVDRYMTFHQKTPKDSSTSINDE